MQYIAATAVTSISNFIVFKMHLHGRMSISQIYSKVAGAYPGFEKVGCLHTVVVIIYRAQSTRDFFSQPRPLIAHARVPHGYYY